MTRSRPRSRKRKKVVASQTSAARKGMRARNRGWGSSSAPAVDRAFPRKIVPESQKMACAWPAACPQKNRRAPPLPGRAFPPWLVVSCGGRRQKASCDATFVTGSKGKEQPADSTPTAAGAHQIDVCSFVPAHRATLQATFLGA